jgi:hypothetical protein
MVDGDLDGDGRVDIIIPNRGSNSVSIFRNTSTNGMIAFARIDLATASNPYRVAVSDMDGDGKLDLVVGHAIGTTLSNTISVFRNTSISGSIAFAPRLDFVATVPGSTSGTVGVGEFDGDGKPDVIALDYYGAALFRNTSTPGVIRFAEKVNLATGSGAYHFVAIADIDGDRKQDLAIYNGGNNGTVSLYRNTGSPGVIGFELQIIFPVGGPYGMSLGDLNGDGKPELVVSNFSSATLSVFKNLSSAGTISFGQKTDYPTVIRPFVNAIGDLDGDGKPDIAVSNQANNPPIVSVFKNTSSGDVISLAPRIDYGTGYAALSIVIVDLDGDGKPDLAAANSGSQALSVFRNQTACAPCTPLTFNQQVVDVTCGKNDGRLLLTPTSGTAPFFYSINGGTTYVSGPDAGYTFSELSPGTFQLRVKDATGCESVVVHQTLGSGCPTPCTPPTLQNNRTIVNAPTSGQNNRKQYVIPT